MKKVFLVNLLFLLFFNASHAQSPYVKLLTEGAGLESQNDLVGAKIKYTQAIGLKSDEFKAFLFRGKVSYRLKEYNDAIADLTKVIEMQPNNTNALSVRSRAYSELNEWDKAINDQTNLLSIVPKKDDLYKLTLSRRANAFMELERYVDAIADFTTLINNEVLTSGEVNMFFYKQRGISYFKLGKFSEASADLEAYCNKSPNDAGALYLLGLSNYNNGSKDKALKIANRILDVDPTKKIAYSNRNLLEMFEYARNKEIYLAEYNDVKEQLVESLAIPSQNLKEIEFQTMYLKTKNIWNQLVIPFHEDLELRDSIEQTLKILYAGISVKPEINEEARKLVVQANTSTDEKNYDEAIFLYSKALRIEPCNHLAYYNMALLYAQKSSYETAITSMQEYIKIYPNAPDKRAAQDLIYEWEGKKGNISNSYSNESELLNTMKDNKADQAFFIASYGFVKPLGNATLFNSNETIENRFFNSGRLGMQNGFYIEMGGGGGSFSNQKRVGVSLELLLRYRHHKLDWKTAGGIFANPNNYVKDFRFLEISEKLGMWIRPALNTFVHLYYAPSAVLQLETQFLEETDTYYQSYTIGGDYFRISHTLGASLRYRFFALSYEWDYVPFKFDIRNYYNDKLTGIISDVTTTDKSKLKFGTFRLSFYL